MTDLSDPADVMARTLWGEARGEGTDGMKAVACVVMNRVANPGWWGRDVISVCLKAFQFSCWLPNDPNRAKLLSVTQEDMQFAEAVDIAHQAISGLLTDETDGATSYYERHITAPHWVANCVHTVDIGNHRFFKNAA